MLLPALQERLRIAPALRRLLGVVILYRLPVRLGGLGSLVIHRDSSNRFVHQPQHIVQPLPLHEQQGPVLLQGLGAVVVRGRQDAADLLQGQVQFSVEQNLLERGHSRAVVIAVSGRGDLRRFQQPDLVVPAQRPDADPCQLCRLTHGTAHLSHLQGKL